MTNNLIIKLFFLVAVGSILFLQACKTKPPTTTEIEKQRNPSTPPNNAKIIGEVVEILENDSNFNNSDICKDNPCRAKVKVIQVLEYGMAFPPLNVGQEITINFANSLSPQTEPKLKGLNVGDDFEALVAHSEIMGGGASYTIYSYK